MRAKEELLSCLPPAARIPPAPLPSAGAANALSPNRHAPSYVVLVTQYDVTWCNITANALSPNRRAPSYILLNHVT